MKEEEKRKVYLAGPGVFRRDADRYGDALKQRCEDLGLVPLWPLDNKPPKTGDRAADARALREMNCRMIEDAGMIVADISPFRGPNMDPGTAFEIGFAAALGKKIFLYSEAPGTLLDRTEVSFDLTSDDGKRYDSAEMEVEDFGLRENLMIASCVDQVYGSFEDAVLAAAKAAG